MPESNDENPYAQTLVIEADEFSFEPLEQVNGLATVVRFQVHNPLVKPGDVLVVLSGDEVCFHGLIGRIDDGWAVATDRRGSLLIAAVS
jgi:hypothetical protein